MPSLADALIPADWMQPQPTARIKPPACPTILFCMDQNIASARTEKARAMYEQRKNLYLEATSHDNPY